MKKYVKPELEVVMFTTESITNQPQYYGYDRGMEQGPSQIEVDDGGI